MKSDFLATSYILFPGSYLLVIGYLAIWLVTLNADGTNYKLAAPKKNVSDEGKQLFFFVNKVLSVAGFPKFLQKITYMNENEKSNILYLMLTFKDKFSSPRIRFWIREVVKQQVIDKDFFEVLVIILTYKKKCSKKILIKFKQLGVNTDLEKEYKQKCKY